MLTKEEIELSGAKRIFLSHRGTDKPLVRKLSHALHLLGYDPWLDEDAMCAGVELERGLLQGMKESCAAVFFVSPDYKDEGFPATEVNYAMGEKRSKGDRFAIITLVLRRGDAVGAVPGLLRQYVWKEPESDLDMLIEIVKALPISPGPVIWRDGVA